MVNRNDTRTLPTIRWCPACGALPEATILDSQTITYGAVSYRTSENLIVLECPELHVRSKGMHSAKGSIVEWNAACERWYGKLDDELEILKKAIAEAEWRDGGEVDHE